jgi:long-chain fatty acid transport protein
VIGGHGWNRTSSSLLPNYFGVIQPLGNKVKIGISYAVPESIMADQDQTFTDLPLSASLAALNPGVRISSYIINFNEESNTYNFGPSIAYEISNTFSTGLTLYYYQRKTQFILNQLIKTTNGGYEWTNNYFQTEEKGLRPVLGFMFTPIEKFSFGVSLSKIFVNSPKPSFKIPTEIGIAVGFDTDGDGAVDQTVSDEASLPDGH